MINNWEVWIGNQRGTRVAPLRKLYQIGATLVTNGVGAWSLVLPAKVVKDEWLVTDAIIELWRRPFLSTQKLVTIGYLRRIEYYDNDRGTEMIEISGPDCNELLNTRIIAYPSGSSEALKSGYADDLMKEFVGQNMGTGTSSDRSLSPYNFTVTPGVNLAPVVSKGASYDNLLKTLQSIAATSTQMGTPLFFRVIPQSFIDGSVGFTFDTMIGQPGDDRTSLTFSKRNRNMVKPTVIIERSSEITVVYAGGPGEGKNRLVSVLSDTTRIGESIWNRRESFINAFNARSSEELDDRGHDALFLGRPKTTMSCMISSSTFCRYGMEWSHGDKVSVDYQGHQYQTIVKTTPITVSKNRESIQPRVEVTL